jgi:hypothetical protein
MFLQHPQYVDDGQFFYDFALLRLAYPATLSDVVGIVCLATDSSQRFVGTELTASGWGDTFWNAKQPSPQLKKTLVVGITQELCSWKYQNTYRIIPNLHICAEATNTDACKGDSGGISLELPIPKTLLSLKLIVIIKLLFLILFSLWGNLYLWLNI